MKFVSKVLSVTINGDTVDLRGSDLAADRLASAAVSIGVEEEKRLMFGTPSSSDALPGLLSPTPRPPTELQRRILDQLLAERDALRAGGWLFTTEIARRLGAPLPAVASALMALRQGGSIVRYETGPAGRGQMWALPDAQRVRELRGRQIE